MPDPQEPKETGPSSILLERQPERNPNLGHADPHLGGSRRSNDHIPLRSTAGTAASTLILAGTAYFALIGTGFMMTEITLLQRISVFLGHPVYALSVVLFSLILSTGLGSLASERIPLDSSAKLTGWSVITSLYLLALPSWLPEVLLYLESANLVFRAGLAVLVLAPAGFLMGFGFPTGMRLVAMIDEGPTPWFWGINGAAGVLAASVAVLTSIEFESI